MLKPAEIEAIDARRTSDCYHPTAARHDAHIFCAACKVAVVPRAHLKPRDRLRLVKEGWYVNGGGETLSVDTNSTDAAFEKLQKILRSAMASYDAAPDKHPRCAVPCSLCDAIDNLREAIQ
jgi:hypothetical protein